MHHEASVGIDAKCAVRGIAAHLKVLITVLELIRLAIMIADKLPSPLDERLIVSIGSSPFSCLIGSGSPSILRKQWQQCQPDESMGLNAVNGRYSQHGLVGLEH